MFVNVLLLNGFSRALTYKVPEHLSSTMRVGAVVRVPLQRRFESALVQSVMHNLKKDLGFAIRDVHSFEVLPNDSLYNVFLERVAQYYCIDTLVLYQRVHQFLESDEDDEREPLGVYVPSSPVPYVTLTDEQLNIVEYIVPHILQPSYQPVLIHGVTGSGKTEVYKKLIQEAYELGKTVVLLLPEVTLALQFQVILSRALPNIPMHGFHSATTPSRKKDVWRQLVQGVPMVLVGVHLPVLLPIQNLGLIIVDEEHEQGFGEKKHPRLNSKQIALIRAHFYKVPIVLGSATPCVQSLYNVEKYGWKLFEITKRFAGAFPVIQKVMLTVEGQKRRKQFWISPELERGIAACLEKKEQVIIFINRRGYSFFVQCKSCGFVFSCTDCSVSLTLHMGSEPSLRCHYCGLHTSMPSSCTSCHAPEKSLLKKGIGTQQAVQILQELFPKAVIERADLDSTSKKRAWEQTVDKFSRGEIDMLVGTQTITKGYHFPNVSLVGVVWADLNLHFPVYNARETALQQIIQVAGRAGRQRAGGKVIVQVMRDNPVFDFVDEQRYMTFARAELSDRQMSNYPPFVRLATLEIRHAEEAVVDRDAEAIAEALELFCQQREYVVTVLGPAHPSVHRIERYELRHIVLKASSQQQLHSVLSYAQSLDITSTVFVVMG